MKFFSLLLPVAFIGLGSAFSTPVPAVVSGHITHPQGNRVFLIYDTGPISGGPRGMVEGKLDAKGNFRLEVPRLTAATSVTFGHGQETTICYLSPGDRLAITLDPGQFDETIRFSGSGAAASNYLAQAYLKFDDNPAGSPLAQATTSSAAAVRQLADASRQQRLAYLGTYARAHPLPPAFRAYARHSILFGWATTLLTYPQIRRETAKPALPPALPADYYDFLAAVRPAQDSALRTRNPQYEQFLANYAFSRLPDPTQSLSTEALLTATRGQFGDGPSRDLVAAIYVYQVLDERGAAAAAPLLPAFWGTNRDSACARSIREAYRQQPAIDRRRQEVAAHDKQVRQVLAAGKEAPDFTVRDASGQPVRLAQYKGRVVYLDFWASWCGPCLAEVPAGVTLKKQFEGRDVVFLYISIDEKVENWTKALNTNSLRSANSVHVLDKGWGAPAPKAYLVNSIPAYFLIGRDGRLAVDETPRPSAGAQTVTLLNEALAKK